MVSDLISTSFCVGGVHITMYLFVLFDCVLYLFFFSFLGYTIHSLRPTTTKTNNNYISLVSNVSSVKRNTVLGIRARISQNKTKRKKEKRIKIKTKNNSKDAHQTEKERTERSEIGEMSAAGCLYIMDRDFLFRCEDRLLCGVLCAVCSVMRITRVKRTIQQW